MAARNIVFLRMWWMRIRSVLFLRWIEHPCILWAPSPHIAVLSSNAMRFLWVLCVFSWVYSIPPQKPRYFIFRSYFRFDYVVFYQNIKMKTSRLAHPSNCTCHLNRAILQVAMEFYISFLPRLHAVFSTWFCSLHAIVKSNIYDWSIDWARCVQVLAFLASLSLCLSLSLSFEASARIQTICTAFQLAKSTKLCISHECTATKKNNTKTKWEAYRNNGRDE